jgi:hypothetical protein
MSGKQSWNQATLLMWEGREGARASDLHLERLQDAEV